MIKNIIFHDIPGSERDQDEMPDGYEGLNWENVCYVEESYAHSHLTSPWKNLFKYSRYGIHNVHGSQTMYIRSSRPGKTFTVTSLDATVVDRSGSDWVITGLNKNVKIHSQQVRFREQGQYQLLQLDYADIDEIQIHNF